MINVFQPSLGLEELNAVSDVFRSNWVGKGKVTAAFERAFAQHLQASPTQVASISCCTEGLFQAIQALNIGPGDEVVLPTISFVGAANAIAAAGARPVFCDVHPLNLNASVTDIERALTPRTKAILLLHYGGLSYQLPMIAELAQQRKLFLIEDAACSVASRAQNKACGTFGDVGVWSFDAMKILVCGDGGMVHCKDPDVLQRIVRNSYLGLRTESGLASRAEDRWWEFEIDSFGRRATMNDIASSIGLVQLRRLPAFINRRRFICETYDRELRQFSWIQIPPKPSVANQSSYYLYHIQVGSLRDALARFLKARGIYTTFRYYPLHRVARYASSAHLPCADRAAAATLCLPVHQSLTSDEQGAVLEAIKLFGKTL